MKEYNFEYTRQDFAYYLFGLSFAIIVLGMIVICTFRNLPYPGITIIVLFLAAVLFFLLNKHRIKRTGVAKLSMEDLTLILNQSTYIAFSDLKYYYLYNGKNGIVFTLGFLNGSKFKIGANDKFCDIDSLKTFLTDFQSTIENYKVEHQVNIIHLESIYARKQTPYVLGILTILDLLGFFFTHMPLMCFPIGLSVSLIVSWIKYFQMRSNHQLVDF